MPIVPKLSLTLGSSTLGCSSTHNTLHVLQRMTVRVTVTHYYHHPEPTSLFLLTLNVVCLADEQQLPILQSLVWSDQDSKPRSTAFQESTLSITPPMRFESVNVFIICSSYILQSFRVISPIPQVDCFQTLILSAFKVHIFVSIINAPYAYEKKV